MPPFQICRNGLEHDAVISRSSNSTHGFAGRPKSEYSTLAVICVSIVTINSTFGFTFLIMPYAHLALLIRFTFVVKIAFVGVGMCDLPVNTLRPSLGVLTISGRSPWFQYAG